MLNIPSIPMAIASVLSVTAQNSPSNGKHLVCVIQFPLPKEQSDKAKLETEYPPKKHTFISEASEVHACAASQAASQGGERRAHEEHGEAGRQTR